MGGGRSSGPSPSTNKGKVLENHDWHKIWYVILNIKLWNGRNERALIYLHLDRYIFGDALGLCVLSANLAPSQEQFAALGTPRLSSSLLHLVK